MKARMIPAWKPSASISDTPHREWRVRRIESGLSLFLCLIRSEFLVPTPTGTHNRLISRVSCTCVLWCARAGQIAAATKAKLLILTHFSPRYFWKAFYDLRWNHKLSIHLPAFAALSQIQSRSFGFGCGDPAHKHAVADTQGMMSV